MEKTFKHDGKEYSFEILKLNGKELPTLPAASGVYVLGKESGGKVEPLYIGQSVDMAKRIGDKEKVADAVAHGANVICIAKAPEAAIADIENELVAKYNPPLQVHRK